MTLRPSKQGSQKLLVHTSKIPREKWIPLLMQEDWVVSCQALYPLTIWEEWIGMHETLKEVSTQIGVEKAGQRVARLGIVTVEIGGRTGACFRQEVGLAWEFGNIRRCK